MITGNFYYLKDSYYKKFPNCNLIGNKEENVEGRHDRPCFYCFEREELYWMIPISSQIKKYEKYIMIKCCDIKEILTEYVLGM